MISHYVTNGKADTARLPGRGQSLTTLVLIHRGAVLYLMVCRPGLRLLSNGMVRHIPACRLFIVSSGHKAQCFRKGDISASSYSPLPWLRCMYLT